MYCSSLTSFLKPFGLPQVLSRWYLLLSVLAGFAPAARRRRPARRAAEPASGEISEAKTVIFRFLIKNIDFLLKSTQLELRKNTQTVTQKVDTNAQTHT